MSNPFGDTRFERKPSGAFIVDGKEVAHTLRCCHCGGHFVSVRGSGKKRGWCTVCRSITCGKAGCDVCVPFEARLEVLEGRTSGRYKDGVIRLLDRHGNVL